MSDREEGVDTFSTFKDYGIQLSRFSIVGLLTKFFIIINALISLKIFTNIFPASEYGIYVFCIVLADTITMICTLSFSNASSRFTLLYDEKNMQRESKDIVFTAVFSTLLLEIAAIALLFIFYSFNVEFFVATNYFSLLIVTGFVSMFAALNGIFNSIFRARQMLKWYMSSNLLSSYLGLLLSIFFVLILELQIIGILVGLVLGRFCNFLIISAFLLIKKNIGRFSRARLKEMLNFGLPQTAMMVIGAGSSFLMNFLILIYLSSEDVAFFSVGSTISNLYRFPLIGFNIAYPIIITKMWEQGKFDELKILIGKMIKLIIAFSVPVLVFIYVSSPLLIIIMANRSYLSALIVIPYLLVSVFIGSLANIVNGIGFVTKRTDLVAKAYIVSAIFYTVSFVLIPSLKLIGACIAILIFNISYLFFSLFIFQRRFKINFEPSKIFWIVLASFSGILVFSYFERFVIFNSFINLAISISIYISLIIISKAITFPEIKFLIDVVIRRSQKSETNYLENSPKRKEL